MATLQGSFSKTSVIGTRLEFSESSYNVSQNTSNVHVKFYVISINKGYTTATTTGGTATITVNGESKTITVPNFNIAIDEVWLVGECDFTVKHGEDGKKTVSVSSYLNTGLGSSSLSGSLKLTDIPRKSTFGTISDFILDSEEFIGNPFSVPITKSVSTFYQVLNISIQNNNIAIRENFNGGEVTFTKEELQNIYEKMSKVTFTNFKFELVTYENEGKAKVIGTDTKENVKGYLSTTDLKPIFDLNSVTYEDTNLKTYAITKNKNIFIKNYSDLKITFNQKAIAKKGAYLENSYIAKVTTKDGMITKSVHHTDSFPISLEFEKITDQKLDIFVLDSRESRFPSFDEYQNIVMWDYEPVKINIENSKIYRVNGVEASSFIQISGNYYDFSEKPGVNTITSALIKYKEKDKNGEYVEVDVISDIVSEEGKFQLENYSLGELDITKEYEVVIEIEDMLSKDECTLYLNSSTPYIWHQKKKKVMGIGGKPKDGLKEGSIQVYGGLYLSSGNEVLDYEVSENNSIILKDKALDSRGIVYNNQKLSEVLEQDVMMLTLSSNATITSTAKFQALPIPFDKIGVVKGNKLSFENNGIKIGKNISKVKISLFGTFYGANSQHGLHIVCGWTRAGHYESWTAAELVRNISNYILEVKENDIIQGAVYFGAANTKVTANSGCFLTVEVIE